MTMPTLECSIRIFSHDCILTLLPLSGPIFTDPMIFLQPLHRDLFERHIGTLQPKKVPKPVKL